MGQNGAYLFLPIIGEPAKVSVCLTVVVTILPLARVFTAICTNHNTRIAIQSKAEG